MREEEHIPTPNPDLVFHLTAAEMLVRNYPITAPCSLGSSVLVLVSDTSRGTAREGVCTCGHSGAAEFQALCAVGGGRTDNIDDGGRW